MGTPLSRLTMRVAALCSAAFIGANAARAQTVTGQVVGKADGAVIAGAIVALLDSAGHTLQTRLAEDDGTFTLTLSEPGTYALRVERVGFRSTTTAPFLVRQGETIRVPIAIINESVTLRAIKVSADRRCVVRPQEGLAAAQLWEEARKALSATQLTQMAQAAGGRRGGHRFTVRIRKFIRDLEPHTLQRLREENVEVEGEVIKPFTTADPELLARDGYVAGSIEIGSTFFAPDADVLLSERFLDAHCFRVQPAEGDHRDELIGLGFEPIDLTSGPRVEVRGVLWLDRATAELRYMEYEYVNLRIPTERHQLGGLLEFRPLPDGRWVVWRWSIRTPLLKREVGPSEPYTVNSGTLNIAGVREQGAEVLEVLTAQSRRRTVATLHGRVVDSLRNAPMAGVRVFLSGTSFAAVTDSVGTYAIESITPGKYVASVLTARLDSLLLDPPARDLTLSAGEIAQLDFALPSLRTISMRLCAQPMSDSLSLIIGVVRDSASAVTGANVRAEWTDISRAGTDRLRTQQISNETLTSNGGRYFLCGIPADRRLTVKASRGKAQAVSAPQLVTRGEVRRVDLTFRRP
jgi:hypothetical protein